MVTSKVVGVLLLSLAQVGVLFSTGPARAASIPLGISPLRDVCVPTSIHAEAPLGEVEYTRVDAGHVRIEAHLYNAVPARTYTFTLARYTPGSGGCDNLELGVRSTDIYGYTHLIETFDHDVNDRRHLGLIVRQALDKAISRQEYGFLTQLWAVQVCTGCPVG